MLSLDVVGYRVQLFFSATRVRRSIRMAPILAFRNLFHDRLSFFVTVIGIIFSVVLIAFQSGIYLGIERTISTIIDHSKGELWVVPIGTKSVDDVSLLSGREKHSLLSVPGVSNVEVLAMGFARWRKRDGGSTTVVVVGSDWKSGGLRPWNVVGGSVAALSAPKAIAVDRLYLDDLEVKGLGDAAEINGMTVEVAALTKSIRSFTTMPYVFTTLERAQMMLGADQRQGSSALLTLMPDADPEEVRRLIQIRLPDIDVFKRHEFRQRSIDYWLYRTAAGSSLISGTVLALIVGFVIVAQTLYSSTKDHLNEFATLRALGASASYIIQVILFQALFSAIVGYAVGICLTLSIFKLAEGTTLNVLMTPGLALLLFSMTVGMCVFAASAAIIKIIRIDPASVFSR